MLQQVARVGALTMVSIGVGSVFRPVGRIIGGAAETVANTVGAAYKTVNYANRQVIRSAEIADLKGASRYEVQRLELENDQQASLITFAERTMTLKERYVALPQEMRDLIDQRERRFPAL